MGRSATENCDDAHRKAIPAQRFGTPEEFGAICAFLCSVQAGYMTGQNVLTDGGAFPELFKRTAIEDVSVCLLWGGSTF